MPRVCLWSTDPVGAVMAGPGIRYHRLASELAHRFEITLAAPGGGVPAAPYTFADPAAGAGAALAADVVVAQSLPLPLLRRLRRKGVAIVFDLYAPALVEAAARLADEDTGSSSLVRFEEVVAATRVSLELGDGFICASERQRDHWLGALAVLGRVTPEAYAADPSLDGLVGIVPFGLEPFPLDVLERGRAAEVAGLRASDRLVLWGGGIWNWLDPLTVIRAAAAVSVRRPEVVLVFLGLAHPSASVGAMRMADRAVALARELGVEGGAVRFNRDWVGYDDRRQWFARADVGVSAHLESLESRLAYRTRVLDHIAAGTPLVVTTGDVLADLVESHGLGRVVPPGDVDAWVAALGDVLDARRGPIGPTAALRTVHEELGWRRSADALAEVIGRVSDGRRPGRRGRPAELPLLRAAAVLTGASLRRRGLVATVRAASSRGAPGSPQRRPRS